MRFCTMILQHFLLLHPQRKFPRLYHKRRFGELIVQKVLYSEHSGWEQQWDGVMDSKVTLFLCTLKTHCKGDGCRHFFLCGHPSLVFWQTSGYLLSFCQTSRWTLNRNGEVGPEAREVILVEEVRAAALKYVQIELSEILVTCKIVCTLGSSREIQRE